MKKLIMSLLLLVLPLSVMAMDAVTNAELDGVAGQAGVTIAFGGNSTTVIDFSQLAWGDPDGLSTCGSTAGWLIIDGTITISQIIADGQRLTLDIGTTAGTSCDIGGASSAVYIPANETFIAIGLPDVTMTITVPSTLYVGLASSSSAINGTLGVLNLKQLSVTAGTPTTLYIWAH